MSIIQPSDLIQKQQSLRIPPAVDSETPQRTALVARDFFSAALEHTQSGPIQSLKDRHTQFQKDLDLWEANEKAQNPENLSRIELAKNIILKCYNSGITGRVLGLEHLCLKSVPVHLFPLLTNLTVLDLKGNQLTSFDAPSLTSLEALFLEGNQLTSVDVSKCPNLHTLDLDSNRLTSFDTPELKNLRELRLGYNRLSSINVSGLPNLRYLYLNNNQLTSFNASGLVNLTELYLCQNRISSFDAPELTSLTRLEMYCNRLTSFDASKFPNLRRLILDNNGLHPIPVDTSMLRNLKELLL